MRDLAAFEVFMEDLGLEYNTVKLEDLQRFIESLAVLGISERSRARIISGIRAFYRYCDIDGILKNNPTELLDQPKLPIYIPDVLSVEEVKRIIESVDLSEVDKYSGLAVGLRNRAIMEMLYGSGLRVSELLGIRLSQLAMGEDFCKILGKGNKERLVPISTEAKKAIGYWIVEREKLPIKYRQDDVLFLNRRGAKMTRQMIFQIIKTSVEKAGITKIVSPHTFRHSFATHLLEGGANLRVIQQLLGHSSIVTTEIYTHIDMRMMREEILKFHPRNSC